MAQSRSMRGLRVSSAPHRARGSATGTRRPAKSRSSSPGVPRDQPTPMTGRGVESSSDRRVGSDPTHPADRTHRTPTNPSPRPTPTQTKPNTPPEANPAGPAPTRTPAHDHTQESSGGTPRSLLTTPDRPKVYVTPTTKGSSPGSCRQNACFTVSPLPNLATISLSTAARASRRRRRIAGAHTLD